MDKQAKEYFDFMVRNSCVSELSTLLERLEDRKYKYDLVLADMKHFIEDMEQIIKVAE